MVINSQLEEKTPTHVSTRAGVGSATSLQLQKKHHSRRKPASQTLQLAEMCGHLMVSVHFPLKRRPWECVRWDAVMARMVITDQSSGTSPDQLQKSPLLLARVTFFQCWWRSGPFCRGFGMVSPGQRESGGSGQAVLQLLVVGSV